MLEISKYMEIQKKSDSVIALFLKYLKTLITVSKKPMR